MSRTRFALLTSLLALALAPSAMAQAPGYDTGIVGTFVPGNAQTPSTGERRVGGAEQATVAPTGTTTPKRTTRCSRRTGTLTCRTSIGRRLEKRCTTRGSGSRRVRRCNSYDARGRVTKTCTKRGSRAVQCKRVRGRSAVAGALPAAAARATPPGRAWSSARRSSGFTNPVLPPVVRFYHQRSEMGTKGWCSGTLVRRGLVLTAAHCLYGNQHDGNGFTGYFPVDGYSVVPGNTPSTTGGDATPYGAWRVQDAWVPEGWKQNDGGLDWGLVLLAPDANGRYPGDSTGTYSATWGAKFGPGERLYRVGYPSSGPYNTPGLYYGGGQYFCDMTWDGTQYLNDAYTASSFSLATTPCEMNGGCSGGPVFAYFEATREWSIVGVNNRGTSRADGFGDTGLSFYLDDRFGAFWNSVMGVLGAS